MRAPFGIVGIGIMLLGVAGLLSRVGIAWSFAVLVLGLLAAAYAFMVSPSAAALAFSVAAALVVLGGLAHAAGRPGWFAFGAQLAGLVAFALAAWIELPRARRGGWSHPTKHGHA